jgi:hypothetical protein
LIDEVLMNAYRFNGCHSCRLAALSIVLGCGFWVLGDTFSPAIAGDRITGAEAVARMSVVLGSPEQFADNMKNSTQDFIADHFGSMAIACAFGIAIRMRS